MQRLPLMIWSLTASLALHAGALALLATAFGAPRSATQAEPAGKPLQVTLAYAGGVSAERSMPLTVAASAGAGTRSGQSVPESLPVLPGPYYFPPDELSRKPQPASPVPLDYPADSPLVARGRIVLRLLINEAGNVDQVMVEQSELPQELAELARRAFSQARFQPGMKENRPVNSQLMIEVTFESNEAPAKALPPNR